ncbi:MAG: tyrosine-type recombinase/integrase [Streptosporangiaceae bacterium]
MTGKERRFKRTVKTEARAVQELAALLEAAEAGRAPEDSATMGLALDRYLEVTDLAVSTRMTHESYIRRIIQPVLGEVKLRRIGPDSLDALYAHLRRCSRLCGRLPKVEHCADGPHECDERCGPLRDHRTTWPHQCDQRCRPHQCTPLSPASIVKVHAIISATLNLAVRYEWIDRNPAERATLPRLRKRDPDPPSPREAARLLNEVFAKDEEFGLYLWAAMTTGARRGELLALRENRFDFEGQQVTFSRNYLVKNGQRIEKDTKTGQGRRVSLDPLTCELFAGHFARRRAAAAAAGVAVPADAFAFSPDPAGSQPWNPDTMTHRYERYAAVVGISSSLKELRHYSATQLLSNGVDLRTVAGRLGHSEGSTTLRFYAQFARPADQHAATVLSGQLADLRKKEQLRGLFEQLPPVTGAAELMTVVGSLAPIVGLDLKTALGYLTEFAGYEQHRSSAPRSDH